MKFRPLMSPIKDPGQDYEQSVRIDRWNIGESAFYAPDGFRSMAYLPLGEIRSAYPHDFSVKGGCCCTSMVPAGGLVITYGEMGVIKILPGSVRNGSRILEELKKRIPDLDTRVPEIYRK